jgi:hypothetical protein
MAPATCRRACHQSSPGGSDGTLPGSKNRSLLSRIISVICAPDAPVDSIAGPMTSEKTSWYGAPR